MKPRIERLAVPPGKKLQKPLHGMIRLLSQNKGRVVGTMAGGPD
jgi:hypothetical protein